MSGFTLQRFKVTVKHDHGITKIVTVATSKDAAKNMVCMAEGCPLGAIKACIVISQIK